MSKADSPRVFLVIGVLLMLSLVVDAQPTVDDGESCKFDETARDVKLIRKDLNRLLGSHQQSYSQCSAIDSSSLCE